MQVVTQQRKQRHSTCRKTPVSLDGDCYEIRFETSHFKVEILRCQKIRTAHYNVPILQGGGKGRVHLCKEGAALCRKRKVPYMQHCRRCKSLLHCRWVI